MTFVLRRQNVPEFVSVILVVQTPVVLKLLVRSNVVEFELFNVLNNLLKVSGFGPVVEQDVAVTAL